ncbi:hypothetical protein GCM10007111_03690 [Virgibacillus kapii]|uniref:Uncharacterized protein n=1 Tax=Virgibacillus kapii TaxID=1638645 RepID=A0ABQ2D3R2_9BACI|nr:hypothetical protein M948_14925 [Virgibacillus sp. CM-4]GGJ44964.1 hypothetical protein GCM10007111_03690 [Virgibacillus kapii]
MNMIQMIQILLKAIVKSPLCSSDPVSFRVSIDQKYDHSSFNVMDIINLKDHQLKLDANEHRTIDINFKHRLQSLKHQSVGGQLYIFNLIIADDDNKRRL